MKLSRQGQLGELWRKAGLVNVEEQALTIDQRYASFNDYWESSSRAPARAAPTSSRCRSRSASSSSNACARAC